MNRMIAVMVLLATFAASASDLAAKPLSRIISDIGLTPDDFAMMNAAGDSLYVTASPRAGKVVSWSNPDSNSHGTVKLATIRENCVFLQHFVFPMGNSKSREIRLRMCQNADGDWLLQP